MVRFEVKLSTIVAGMIITGYLCTLTFVYLDLFSSSGNNGNDLTSVNDIQRMESYIIKPLSNGIRLACMVTSHVRSTDKLNAVFDTWARKCDKLVVLGKGLNGSLDNNTNYIRDHERVLFKTDLKWDDHGHLVERTFVGYRLAGKMNTTWDWLLKADDDTFIHIRNLRRFLERQTLYVPTAFGFTFKTQRFSGGAGYVINRAGYDRIDLDGSPVAECKPSMDSVMPEDVQMSKCMLRSGINIGNSMEGQKQRFHPLDFKMYIAGSFPVWMYTLSSEPPLKGNSCCSKETISFHYVKPDQQYLMENIIDEAFKNN